MKSNGMKTPVRWLMRLIACASLLFLTLVPEAAAETVEVERSGTQKVMGTLLGVRVEGDLLLVKVRLHNNLERDVRFQDLDPAGQDKVLTLMVPAARINGAKIPALKFAASKRTENNTRRNNSSIGGKSIRVSYTVHELTVLNSGVVPTDRIMMCQLTRTVEGSSGGKQVSWDLDDESVDALPPGQRHKVPFTAMEEMKQVNIEGVYLMAFDAMGTLIYFVKV